MLWTAKEHGHKPLFIKKSDTVATSLIILRAFKVPHLAAGLLWIPKPCIYKIKGVTMIVTISAPFPLSLLTGSSLIWGNNPYSLTIPVKKKKKAIKKRLPGRDETHRSEIISSWGADGFWCNHWNTLKMKKLKRQTFERQMLSVERCTSSVNKIRRI